jgi:membrane protease subunit (stomatin/prohibitin family)
VSLFGKGDLNRQFIARPDEAKGDILYKWPDLTIRKLTQVTVQPDETALFIKEGKVAGTLPQGRSTLDGALIPFLGDIVDWASGGNMYRSVDRSTISRIRRPAWRSASGCSVNTPSRWSIPPP